MDPNLCTQPESIFFHCYAHCVKNHTDEGYANVYTACTYQIYVKRLKKELMRPQPVIPLNYCGDYEHLPPADHAHPNIKADSWI